MRPILMLYALDFVGAPTMYFESALEAKGNYEPLSHTLRLCEVDASCDELPFGENAILSTKKRYWLQDWYFVSDAPVFEADWEPTPEGDGKIMAKVARGEKGVWYAV